MADTKIYNLTEDATPLITDVIPTVDVTANETKKVPYSTILDTFYATTSQKGTVKMTVAPATADTPLAVGDNDPRMTQIGNLVPYAVDAAGSDTYVITPSPAISAYVTGQQFNFKVGTANTGAATLNVNGLGAKTIKKDVTTDLATGDLLADQQITVEYDGTNMQLLSQVAGLKDATKMTGVLPTVNGGTGSAIFAFKNGSTTYDISTADGTQTIAHGLGRIPNKVKITASCVLMSSVGISNAITIYNGTTQSSQYWHADTGTATTESAGATFRISGDGSTYYTTGTVTYDATNISIAWVKTNLPTGTAYLLWEVE